MCNKWVKSRLKVSSKNYDSRNQILRTLKLCSVADLREEIGGSDKRDPCLPEESPFCYYLTTSVLFRPEFYGVFGGNKL